MGLVRFRQPGLMFFGEPSPPPGPGQVRHHMNGLQGKEKQRLTIKGKVGPGPRNVLYGLPNHLGIFNPRGVQWQNEGDQENKGR